MLLIAGSLLWVYAGSRHGAGSVPATGAFLLTDYSPELEEHYRIGEEIVCFTDVEDLKEKARHYLANDARREEIARKGYAKALTLPTIADRMRAVIRQVEAG